MSKNSSAGRSSSVVVIDAKKIAKLGKLLSDETRIDVLSELDDVERLNVKALTDKSGHSQPAQSHHLALLRQSKLVTYDREGKNNFYKLTPAGESLVGLLRELTEHVKV